MDFVFHQLAFILCVLLFQAECQHKCIDFKHCMVWNFIPTELVVCRNEELYSGHRESHQLRNYTFLNYQWNILIPEIKPLGYFLPETTLQIQIAVKCAQELHLRLVPKSGGHSYAKYSFGNDRSLIIDLQKMTSLSIDHERMTARVGPGFLNGPLTEKLHMQGGFLIPNAICATLGIAYSLGGGHSFLLRAYGLTLDSILELDMITSDGTLLTASVVSFSDLFWALRGAGGGSFGIVSSYKFKLFPAPSKIIYGQKTYALSEFPNVFNAFQNWAASNPSRSINCVMDVTRDRIFLKIVKIPTPGRNDPSGVIQFFEGNPFPKPNSSSTTNVHTYLDYLSLAGLSNEGSAGIGFENTTRQDYLPVYVYGTEFYVPGLVGNLGVESVNELIQKIPANVSLVFQIMGGAVDDLAPSATAYVHRRSSIYKVQVDYKSPPSQTVGQIRSGLQWLAVFFKVTERIMRHRESYQNIVDPDLPNYLERYYGGNLQRLIHVKNKYDPNNYFSNPQSIPTFSELNSV